MKDEDLGRSCEVGVRDNGARGNGIGESEPNSSLQSANELFVLINSISSPASMSSSFVVVARFQ